MRRKSLQKQTIVIVVIGGRSGDWVKEIFVRASEFPRSFGHLSQTGMTIFVTHHGRETHALLPIARYHAIVSAANDSERGPVLFDQGLADWLPFLLIVVDETRAISLANRTAHAVARKAGNVLIGSDLFEVLPALRETMFESYYNRTARTGEPCSFELPQLLFPGSWHRVETFRTHGGVAILARDITDEMRAFRLADTNKALIDAILVHGGIGYLWINVRGRIEEADQTMSDLLLLPRERLTGVPVADLAPIGRRAALRELIEQVLSQGGARRLATEFLRNDGIAIPAICALKDLRGVYGSEGAVMVATCG